MGRSRAWLAALLLAPFALVVIGMQMAGVTAIAGVTQIGWAATTRSSEALEHGAATLERAADILARAWDNPASRILEVNPITLGAVDDLRASTRALALAADALTPLASMGALVVGFDGRAPLLGGGAIDTSRIDELEEPTTAVADALAATEAALAAVPGTGLLGTPIGTLARSANGSVADLATLAHAAELALPTLPEALGASESKRYLVCALNDAELFASGGAPLNAVMVEAVDGSISAPISGQLESKLSPNNPPIEWEHAGGPPWYREGQDYPFVNSNFHPDFRTASVDIRRAWAALGYPAVDGVVTVDVSALARILDWTGPITSEGYGDMSGATIIRTVLVDAYREFDSPEGVLVRHARNDALVSALAAHLTDPRNLLPMIRGAMDSIPPRHIQAGFRAEGLQDAVEALGATGALARPGGDLIGAFSQSGPNKLSVFQERTISQEVQLTRRGEATVRRTVEFTNAVPDDLAGDPESSRGYLALRARMRVAHRMPTGATGATLVQDAEPIVAEGRIGPYPDERGGVVLWQGHETPAGGTTTVILEYVLPSGTFDDVLYEVRADPQPLATAVPLTIRLSPAEGQDLPDTPGWARSGADLVWTGTLDQPTRLVVG